MDQDDSMMSTPSSHGDEEDSILPETHPSLNDPTIRPQTPQNDHLNASAPGELSPPRSQTNNNNVTSLSSRNRGASAIADLDDEGLGDEVPGLTTNENGGSGAAGAEWKAGMWKSKKAQDEMQKVWETHYVDRDFSLAGFGDVLGHKIGSQTGGGSAAGKVGGEGSAK